MTKISIASYAFHGLLSEGKMDLFGYLESCKYRYHLDTADIWNGMLLSTADDYLAKVKNALDERELVLVNLCVDGAHLWEDDPVVREQHYQNGLAALHAGEMLGALTVRIDAGGREANWTDAQFDFIVKRYQEFAQRAYDNGYKVGPENHWGAEKEPQNMKKLCTAVNHPAFGVLLHFKGTLDECRLMAPWAMHAHLTSDITDGALAESMSVLRELGYDGYWGVEYQMGKQEYTGVGVQIARVRDVLDRWRIGE
ncbi:MAG TPA: TIM barrel protein [Anaerolineae bacterium]|nr:TIM barrel protein [Anaerolineae bacterium]HQH38691.1 TIM barrel protein [Anaerolineae bacterium]